MSPARPFGAIPDGSEEPVIPCLDTFEYFPQLPPEIRHQIWEEHFKIKPRLITLHETVGRKAASVYSALPPLTATTIDPETKGRWKPPGAAEREAHMVATKAAAVAVNESIVADTLWTPWSNNIWFFRPRRLSRAPTREMVVKKTKTLGMYFGPLPVVWAADVLYVCGKDGIETFGCLEYVEWADKIQRLAIRDPGSNEDHMRDVVRKLKSLKLLVIVADIPHRLIAELAHHPFVRDLPRDEFGFVSVYEVIKGLERRGAAEDHEFRRFRLDKYNYRRPLENAVYDVLDEDRRRGDVEIWFVVDIDGRTDKNGEGYWRI